MNVKQLETRLKFCLKGVEYDTNINTPASLERAEKGKQRAEQYQRDIAELERFEREYCNKFIEESEVKI
jgi:hypothetical protein